MDRLIAIFVILLGVNFLLDNFGLPHLNIGEMWKFWPLAMIWVGWTMWREDGPKRS